MKTERFNFDKSCQMHLACSYDEDFSASQCCVYFKDGFAYATDNHILVKNRISECSNLDQETIEALDGKLLHRNFYKEILKYDTISVSEEGIECKKGSNASFFYFAKDCLKYPDAEKVIQETLNKQTIQIPEIKFNLEYFDILKKSLYKSERCNAVFKGQSDPIVFYSTEDDVSSIGIVMPCVIY